MTDKLAPHTQTQACAGTDTHRRTRTHTYTRRDPTGAQKHRAMINVPSEKEIISNKLNYCGSKLKNKDVNEV